MKKQRLRILSLAILLGCFLASFTPLQLRADGLGGFSMGGASFGGAYYSVDELDFRIDLSLDDGFTGWMRIRTFDDYGMLDSEDTEYISWDVTQFEGLVIYGVGSFSFDGQTGTLYLNSDFGLGDGAVLYMMPWDDIDSWDSEDSEDYPEAEPEPEPEAEPETDPWSGGNQVPDVAPAPPVLPIPGGKRPAPNSKPGESKPSTGNQPGPGTETRPMPQDASPIPQPSEAERQAIEALYENSPELTFYQGFSFLDGAASYFARLPRIYDPVERRFFLSSQEIYKLIPRPESVEFKSFSDGSLIARYTNRSNYPIVGAEMNFGSTSNPQIQLTASSDALCMPGQMSPNLYGRQVAAAPLPDDLQLQSITLHVMDKLAGLASLHSDFTTGQISLQAYDSEALEGAHFMDEVELSTLNQFLSGFLAGSDHVTLTNSYRRAIVDLEIQLDYPDGTRHTILAPQDGSWRLAPGETSDLKGDSFWESDFVFNPAPPFTVSEIWIEFEDPDDNYFDPAVLSYIVPLQLIAKSQ